MVTVTKTLMCRAPPSGRYVGAGIDEAGQRYRQVNRKACPVIRIVRHSFAGRDFVAFHFILNVWGLARFSLRLPDPVKLVSGGVLRHRNHVGPVSVVRPIVGKPLQGHPIPGRGKVKPSSK